MRPQAPKYFGTGHSLSADNIYKYKLFYFTFFILFYEAFFFIKFY